MSSTTDDSIEELSRTTLDNFFFSLEGGIPLSSFLEDWADFEKLVEMHKTKLKAETLLMIHTLADTIGTMAADMLQLESLSEQLHRDTEEDVTQMLKELGINNQGTKPQKPSSGRLHLFVDFSYLTHLFRNAFYSSLCQTSLCMADG